MNLGITRQGEPMDCSSRGMLERSRSVLLSGKQEISIPKTPNAAIKSDVGINRPRRVRSTMRWNGVVQSIVNKQKQLKDGWLNAIQFAWQEMLQVHKFSESTTTVVARGFRTQLIVKHKTYLHERLLMESNSGRYFAVIT